MSALPVEDHTTALYERHAGRIYGLCLRRLGSREEAEDATQTTFLNAYGALRRGSHPRFERAWLFRIAENVCLERRQRPQAEVVALPDALPSPVQDNGDVLAGLQDALGELPESQRRAILLREWRGLSYREIGAELGLSEAAAEALAFRARRSLADRLDEGRRRGLRAFDGFSLVSAAKSAFGGGALAAKIAAAAAVVAAAGATAAIGTQVAGRGGEQPSPPAPVQAPGGTDPARKSAPTAPRRAVDAQARAARSGRPALVGVPTASGAGASPGVEPTAERPGPEPVRDGKGAPAAAPGEKEGAATSTPTPTSPPPPDEPVVSVPELPTVSAPELPTVSVPELPSAPELPPAPTVETPSLPEAEVPSLPEAETPTLPEPPALPGLP